MSDTRHREPRTWKYGATHGGYPLYRKYCAACLKDWPCKTARKRVSS